VDFGSEARFGGVGQVFMFKALAFLMRKAQLPLTESEAHGRWRGI